MISSLFSWGYMRKGFCLEVVGKQAINVVLQNKMDKPARLSFSCSLDLLPNDIDQTNINRDIRDGNWLSNLV